MRSLRRIPVYLLLALSPAAVLPAGPAAAAEEAESACFSYAIEKYPQENWTCVGDTLTLLTRSPDGDLVPSRSEQVPRPAAPRSGSLAPTDRVDDYHANSNEAIYAVLDRQKYKINFNLKIGLHNHTGNVSMTFSSQTPVALTYSLRIRRDVDLWPDDTVYGYENRLYGSSTPTRSHTQTEGNTGNGHNRLPYDGKRYFWDAWNLHLRIQGTAITTAGSVQSDRATCYKTTGCKFELVPL
ncbi:hypothetical protein ACIQV3_40520 [Streptomyces sp. NPDC099050]|uniref:hypothetical protein n=1 Tax=Streptomyces sp. NPDC099050 TaxID=3366100 RepID=UPI0037F9AB9F